MRRGFVYLELLQKRKRQLPVAQNRCVMACQGCGAAIIWKCRRMASSGSKQKIFQSGLGKEVQAIVDTDIIYPELNGDPDVIYSFLLVTGYLRDFELSIRTENSTLLTETLQEHCNLRGKRARHE